MLTFPRSGSAWLTDTLDSHPEIRAYSELFLPERRGVPSYAAADLPYFDEYLARVPQSTRHPRVVHQIRYMRKLYADRPGVRAVGFKLMYQQLRKNAWMLPYFSAKRVRVVHLIRANLLDAVISYEVAQETGVFHARRGEDVPQRLASISPGELRDRLEHMEWATARGRIWLERFRLPRIDIAYEELVGRREETFERIMRFLGVEPDVAVLDSGLVRADANRGLERIVNADAVRDALTGTRFEWMLGETLP